MQSENNLQKSDSSKIDLIAAIHSAVAIWFRFINKILLFIMLKLINRAMNYIRMHEHKCLISLCIRMHVIGKSTKGWLLHGVIELISRLGG